MRLKEELNEVMGAEPRFSGISALIQRDPREFALSQNLATFKPKEGPPQTPILLEP
jgi:hypothetical protein